MENHTSNREDFCGACVAIPLAAVGTGVAGLGAKKGNYGKRKKIILWVGVAVTLISLGVAIYFLTRCKECR